VRRSAPRKQSGLGFPAVQHKTNFWSTLRRFFNPSHPLSPWASECPDVKNYKWRLNPVWHRMLYSCTRGTLGVKGLLKLINCKLDGGVCEVLQTWRCPRWFSLPPVNWFSCCFTSIKPSFLQPPLYVSLYECFCCAGQPSEADFCKVTVTEKWYFGASFLASTTLGNLRPDFYITHHLACWWNVWSSSWSTSARSRCKTEKHSKNIVKHF